MNKNKDKLIQQFLDSKGQVDNIGERLEDGESDLIAYKIVFGALQRPLDQGNSYSFKVNLMKRLKLEQRRSKDTVLNLAVTFLMLNGVGIITWIVFMIKGSLGKILGDGQLVMIMEGMVFVILVIVAEQLIENKLKIHKYQ